MFAQILAIAAVALTVNPSQPADTTGREGRLVRLISAESAQLIERGGVNYRKVNGPAQFLHNNTYILCDSAIWNVEQNILDAVGNVQVIQEGTALYSDRIHYIADSSLAQVRGTLVQLVDKEGNRLRTHFLDFHTKDSIARFFNGGSMMNDKGNTIESKDGIYESKIKRFRFLYNVEMKADSTILKADSLAYLTEERKAQFLGRTHIWQDTVYLRAHGGWYERDSEKYLFSDKAYILTGKQELWADAVFYDRKKEEAELFDNIQIVDTVQKAMFFADYGKYKKEPFSVLLTKNPSSAYYSFNEDLSDTLYLSADTLKYYTRPINELDSSFVANAKERLIQSRKDPMQTLIAALPKSANVTPEKSSLGGPPPAKGAAAKDSLKIPKDIKITPDSTLVIPPDDSSSLLASAATAADTSATVADTTTVRFALAYNKVRIYRGEMQALADSLTFNSIDSVARMYRDPVMWNEGSQFTSDSIQFVMSGNKLTKAELSSNAYYISKEDSLYYNQIKSTDMIGFFRENKLHRFDALGGASLLFFLAEDSVITTMNQKECKFLSAAIDSGKLQRVKYFDNIKSDIYPIVKLEKGKDKLKGFRWRGDERPVTRRDVCNREILSTERDSVILITRPLFPNTKRFFPDPKAKSNQPANTPPAKSNAAAPAAAPAPDLTQKKQTGKPGLPVKNSAETATLKREKQR